VKREIPGVGGSLLVDQVQPGPQPAQLRLTLTAPAVKLDRDGVDQLAALIATHQEGRAL
jgi:hypothetical protein